MPIIQKKPQDKTPMVCVPVMLEIFSNVAMATVGPLLKMAKGNRYVVNWWCVSERQLHY